MTDKTKTVLSVLAGIIMLGLLVALIYHLMQPDPKGLQRQIEECRSHAMAETQCENEQIENIKFTGHKDRFAVTFKACKKLVTYEYGTWCEGCSSSCRRVGTKNEK